MALLLAPYNNAMRLGQGFNTYTQQICVDDAVVVDSERAENIITNDGATMRILVQSMGRPSAWSRQKEIVAEKLPDIEHERGAESERAVGKAKPPTIGTKASQGKSLPAVGKVTGALGSLKNSSDEATCKVDGSEPEGKEDTDGDSEVLVESANVVGEAREKAKTPNEAPKTAKLQALAADKRCAGEHPDGKEKRELLLADKERERELRAEQAEIAKEKREQEKASRNLRQQEKLQIEKEKIEHEKSRREGMRKLIDAAASMPGFTKDELKEMQTKINFEPRFTGMAENQKDFDFDSAETSGPSQVVTYSSRFIDKLSDITDDMNISGSLSIKAGKFGGSGRGAFIDSDKFKESDLNFYISVKVVNQTINFKDALCFNSVRSVNGENFRDVFGDGFISGFQEGGEFNALVSMKILNKAKATDIKAEAKVAFTAGSVDLAAEANVNIAKANIETNTETTIQVSWSGGGAIKPREQQWDIQSLMQAAARFPDLVAQRPQRTYAIITKYDSLRSFVKTKPAGYTKLQYDNAQMYTSAMMDSYMGYKSLYTKLGSHIFDVQSNLKAIKPWENSKPLLEVTNKVVAGATGSKAANDLLTESTRFEASVKGLEDGKKSIRQQMAAIVNEVDLIEKDPKLATDKGHQEPFQSPAAFETRLPIVESIEKPKSAAPLGGKRIMTKTQTLEEQAEEQQVATQAGPQLSNLEGLSQEEKTAVDALQAQRADLGEHLRLTTPVGSDRRGAPFTNLDFLLPEWLLAKVEVGVAGGCVAGLKLYYNNGLIVSRGKSNDVRWVEMKDFRAGERITSAAITIGLRDGSKEKCVLSLQLFTNRGRNLIGQAERVDFLDGGKQSRDSIIYTDIETRYFDVPIAQGTLKGMYGRSDDEAISRLGLIWGNLPKTDAIVETDAKDTFTAAPTAQLRELRAALQDKDEAYNAMVLKKDAEIKEVRTLPMPWNRSAAWKSGRVEIFLIMFGNCVNWSDDTVSRFTSLACSQQEFEISSKLFGNDQLPFGSSCRLNIVYRYDGAGMMMSLVGMTGEKIKFWRMN